VDDKRRSRLLGVVAYVGIGLVVLSELGHAYVPIEVGILGFGLILAGAIPLMVLARQSMLRRVPVTPPSPATAAAGAPLPLASAPAPPHRAPDLAAPVRFDLSREYQGYKARMRTAILMRTAMYSFLVLLGVYSIATGLLYDRVAGLVLGAIFIVFGGSLYYFLRQIDHAPNQLTVGPSGVAFEMVPARTLTLRWDDPSFGMRFIVTSAGVNRMRDPPLEGPSFLLFTGRGSGVGSGPRILTEIPVECFRLLLLQGEAHGWQAPEGTEGVVGTVSERRTYRFFRGFGPVTP
jgi:hypothetical protein